MINSVAMTPLAPRLWFQKSFPTKRNQVSSEKWLIPSLEQGNGQDEFKTFCQDRQQGNYQNLSGLW